MNVAFQATPEQSTRDGWFTWLRWVAADSLVIMWRMLQHTWRFPEKMLSMLVFPVIFVVLFGYVFGSAISLPGGADYRSYLMPGIFVQSMAFGSIAIAEAIAADMEKGVIDRFRSLPMARSAVVIGHTLAVQILGIVGLALMVTCGLVVGWRVNASVGNMLAAFGLLLLLQFAMIWIGAFIGLLVRTPEAVDPALFAWLFPATFLANTFVPTQGMPTWLRTIADWNPLSAVTAACRELFGNPSPSSAHAPWPLQHPIVASVGWTTLIIIVFATLAIHRYRHANSR